MRRARPSAVLLLSVSLVLVAGTFAAPSAHAGRRPSDLRLTPQEVVPGPGDPAAAATFTWSTGRAGFNYTVNVENLPGLVQVIAIHRGSKGFAGPEVLRLCPNHIGLTELSGSVPADRTLLREIARGAADHYMVVTTTQFPNGAMRGQLKQ